MSKTSDKWIDWGIGADQANAQSAPATFTPTNFTPAQVASEGTDKVSAFLKGIDDALGIITVGFTDEFFTGDASTTVFNLAADIENGTNVSVYINGILKEETEDWTRDAGANTVTPIITLPTGTRMRVRLYVSAPFTDELFSGGTATFTTATSFEANTRLDVYVNGQLLEETDDWTRNASLDQITLVVGDPGTDARIRVRIWS